ncbi:phage portal protein [Aneurinibacillus tyrosinisolvens]|uniref:phage portal protein n=1 Tax=Aneurinibacillus tyrosinisolvens TaxID=1443435 RepID=UPI00063F6387|nr:phage portal protein [Aneurinibacillus tyrosinisolvens]
MSLQEYIKDKYNDSPLWFVEECNNAIANMRIVNVLDKKEYLSGNHAILNRPNEQFNGKEFISRKIVLNYAKVMVQFQSAFIMKNPITLSGKENVVGEYKKVYKKGKIHQTLQKAMDGVIKYGDSYVYLYFDENKVIKPKLIPSESSYAVFDDFGAYVAFIEHFTTIDNISYWYVYTSDSVIKYSDHGGNQREITTSKNLSGLPIHFHSHNELDELVGRSDLDDYIGILDNMEDLISKATDSFYRYISGIPVLKGQQLKGEGLPTHAIAGGIAIDTDADFKFESNQFDYKAFEALYKTLMQALLDVSGTPAVSMNQSSISNLSEVSIKLLFSLAEIKGSMNERYMREGIDVLHEQLRAMMELQGIVFTDEDYESLGTVFHYNQPQNEKDIIDNLKTLHDMNAISLQSILEQNPYVNDVVVEMERIKHDTNSQPNNGGKLTLNNGSNGQSLGQTQVNQGN